MTGKYLHIKTLLLFQLLLCGSSLCAQKNVLPEWKAYTEGKMLPQEKLFVHSDKDFYLVGEIAWFKIYVVDAFNNKPTDLSKVAYVELISKDNKQVLQSCISLHNGTGDGSLLLPQSLPTGNYILRAYTSWMKNFPHELFFEKHLSIVNTQRKPDWKQLDVADNLQVRFYPEGGNLVKGISSNIAVTVKDRFGKDVSADILLLGASNDTSKKISYAEWHKRSFAFAPPFAGSFKAIITDGKRQPLTVDFPTVFEKGIVMRVEDQDPQRINVMLETTDANESVYMVVHSRQAVKLAIWQSIQNNKAQFEIDKQLLDEGVSCITIFNAARQPLCERLVFKAPASNTTLKISTGKTVYNKRSKVEVLLETVAKDPKQEMLNMSLAVLLIDSLQQLPVDEIQKYFLLQSELPGVDAAKLQPIDVNDPIKINQLLLTAGWRRFRWEDQFPAVKPVLKFLPEYEGQLVKVMVYDKRNGSPVKGVTATLAAPGQHFVFRNAVSNANGEIIFNAKDLYGHNDIVVQAANAADSNYRFEVQKPFSAEVGNMNSKSFYLPETWQQQLEQHSFSVQAQQQFLQEERSRFGFPVEADTIAFYGVPDKQYLLDDYTRFVTMEEVIREYVAEVRLRKNRDNYRYEVLNAPYKNFFDELPLVLIDGMPVKNINKIVAVDPLKVRKLDVVARRFYYGDQAYSGIVSYHTYLGDLGGYQLDPGAVIMEYPGLQLQREFYAPVYDSAEKLANRLPDYRSVLSWMPVVESALNGKTTASFFTGDRPGKYAIIVQGAGTTGKLVSATYFFDVQ